MKLLWYIDCIYYKENNKSLTGLVYVHQKMGALPIAYDELLKLPYCSYDRSYKAENLNHDVLTLYF